MKASAFRRWPVAGAYSPEQTTRLTGGSDLLGPVESAKALEALLQRQEFYEILWKSSKGILSAYLLSFLFALFFSYLSYRYSFLADFLKPAVFVLRSLPVASFIIIFYLNFGRQ